MIIYFYLFIPQLFLSGDFTSIKSRTYKNDIVPFWNSRLDLSKKDSSNNLKLISNEPFLLQFQLPKLGEKTTMRGVQEMDTKKKRLGKKRITKFKPLRKKFRKRRDINEKIKSREEKSFQVETHAEALKSQIKNSTKVPNNRIEILKALSSYSSKDNKKNKFEETDMKTGKNNTERYKHASNKLSRHRKHNHLTTERSPVVKMVYPSTPKSDRHPHKYTYKDLMADRERLEQKIKYIKNMLNVNDTADDPVRIRRRSDSDRTANKIAKMFLTLSAVNGLHDRKKSRCEDDDEDRVQDVWEKERRSSPTRKSTSSNEERYKVKKWIEFMKSKRSSSKICPCLGNLHGEETDAFPLEQKLPKGYYLMERGLSSEESSESIRDPFYYPRDKFGRNNHFKRLSNRNQDDYDTKIKLPKSSKKKIELPLEDLEIYRSRAKQILQNAEEILDRIKEEEERRLSTPNILMSHIKELTSRIQGDPRNKENDLIRKIQKTLGRNPLGKSQENPETNAFLDNVKSYILDPYEKAKALTDESTKKLSSYLLRNLGKLQDSSEEQSEIEEGDDEKGESGLKMYFGQLPRKSEEVPLPASLAKEPPGIDKHKEELQHWEGTLSAMLGGNDETAVKHNYTSNNQEQIKLKMENIMKEQQKKLEEYKDPEESLESEENKNFKEKQFGKDVLKESKSKTTEGAVDKDEKQKEEFNKSSESKEIKDSKKELGKDILEEKKNEAVQTSEIQDKEQKEELIKSSESKEMKDFKKKLFGQNILKEQKSDATQRAETRNEDQNKEDVELMADPGKSIENIEDAVEKQIPENGEVKPKEDENQDEDKVDSIINDEKSIEDVEGTVGEKQIETSFKSKESEDESQDMTQKSMKDTEDVVTPKENSDFTAEDKDEDQDILESIADSEKVEESITENEKPEKIDEDLQMSPITSKENEDNNDSLLEQVLESDGLDGEKVNTKLGDEEKNGPLVQEENEQNFDAEMSEKPNTQDKESLSDILQQPEMNNRRENEENDASVSVEGNDDFKKEDESGEPLQKVNENENSEITDSAETLSLKQSTDMNSSEESEQTNDSGTTDLKEAKDDQNDFAEKNLSEEVKSKLSDYESLVRESEEDKTEPNLRNQQNSMEEQEKNAENNVEENVQLKHLNEEEIEGSEENVEEKQPEDSFEEKSDETLKSSLKEAEILKKGGDTDSIEKSDENIQMKSVESGEEPKLEAEHQIKNEETGDDIPTGETASKSTETNQSEEKNSEELEENSKEKDDTVLNEKNPSELNDSKQLEKSLEDTSEESNETPQQQNEPNPEEKTSVLNEGEVENLQEAKPIQSEVEDTQTNMDETLEDNQDSENDKTMVESEKQINAEGNEENQEKDYENDNNDIGEDANEISQLKAANSKEDDGNLPELKAKSMENSQKSEETNPRPDENFEIEVNYDEDSRLESRKDTSVEEEEGKEEENPLQSSNPEELSTSQPYKTDLSLESTENMKEALESAEDDKILQSAQTKDEKNNEESVSDNLSSVQESQKPETAEQQKEIKEQSEDIEESMENIDDESLVASENMETSNSKEEKLNDGVLLENQNVGEDGEKLKEIHQGNFVEEKLSSKENVADDEENLGNYEMATNDAEDKKESFESDVEPSPKHHYLDKSEETVRAEEINELSNEIDEKSAEDFYPKSRYYSRESEEDENLQAKNPSAENTEDDEGMESEEGFAKLQHSNPEDQVEGKKLKLPKSIGEIMKDLGGKEKQDLNPKEIDDMLDKIDEAEQQNQLESSEVDCRKECACADEIGTRSRNIGRFEIVKDFLHWMKDLQLNRVLTD